jgi:hypothetical protein
VPPVAAEPPSIMKRLIPVVLTFSPPVERVTPTVADLAPVRNR